MQVRFKKGEKQKVVGDLCAGDVFYDPTDDAEKADVLLYMFTEQNLKLPSGTRKKARKKSDSWVLCLTGPRPGAVTVFSSECEVVKVDASIIVSGEFNPLEN